VVGVDGVCAEDFAGVLVDHGDGVGVDEDGDGLAFVGGADAEVVHAAGSAEADFAEAVDVAGADPVVRLGASVGWGGFDGGVIGVGWGGAVERTVWPGLVVDVGEGVEVSSWVCSSARVAAAGWAASQRFRVCWKRSILPWVWGWPGWPFFCVMPWLASRYSKPLRPPVNREVTPSLNVGQSGLWQAVTVGGARKVVITVWPVMHR
jgi:hypothetical protein